MAEEIKIIGDGMKIYSEWLKFEKSIPFYKTYNHLSMSLDNERIIFSVSSKRAEIYRIIKKWAKEYEQKHNEE